LTRIKKAAAAPSYVILFKPMVEIEE